MKAADPAVIADCDRHVIGAVLLAGHHGGANRILEVTSDRVSAIDDKRLRRVLFVAAPKRRLPGRDL
jgi:hypothetical protein